MRANSSQNASTNIQDNTKSSTPTAQPNLREIFGFQHTNVVHSSQPSLSTNASFPIRDIHVHLELSSTTDCR